MLESAENCIITNQLSWYKENPLLAEILVSNNEAEKIITFIEKKYDLSRFHTELKLIFDVYFRKQLKFYGTNAFLSRFGKYDIKQLVEIIDDYFLFVLDTLLKQVEDVDIVNKVKSKIKKFKNLKKTLLKIYVNRVSIENSL